LHRFNWRTASRASAIALTATACIAATAGAQSTTPAATTPAPTTPTNEVATTGAPIAANGTENAPTPGNNECYARLFQPKDLPTGYSDDDSTIVVQYRLRCASEVTGYGFSFNRPVTATETEVFPTLLKDNSVISDESFSCGGDFPGIGLTCTGTYRGRFSSIRAAVALERTPAEKGVPFCKLNIQGSASVFASTVSRDPYTSKPLINKDGSSQIRHLSAGPFKVTTPACHRGASGGDAAKKSKSSKKSSKKS
jgi:hypothetical protein